MWKYKYNTRKIKMNENNQSCSALRYTKHQQPVSYPTKKTERVITLWSTMGEIHAVGVGYSCTRGG